MQNTSIVRRHIAIFGTGAALLAGLYLLYQNTTSVIFGGVVLVFIHLAAVAGIFVLGRGALGRLIERIHRPPAASVQVHSHGNGEAHTHATPVTDGETIDWPSWYDILVKVVLLGKEQQFRESVVDLAKIQSGETVMDVGCGTGTFAIIARQRADPSAKIYATDASPEMIEQARQKAAQAGVTVDFRVEPVEALNFPDDSFDVVMSNFMLHHLPDDLKSRAFAEILRVLKPGGRMLAVDFEPPKGLIGRAILRVLLGPTMLAIDNRTVPPLLEQAGFAGVRLSGAGHKLATLIAGRKPA